MTGVEIADRLARKDVDEQVAIDAWVIRMLDSRRKRHASTDDSAVRDLYVLAMPSLPIP